MSLGFEQAGFDVVGAVEIDPIHAAVHKFNFPDCAVIPRSVIGLTANEIRRAAKVGSKKIDVVFGGAPCQGFSLIGQRALDDPRNRLVQEFVRIVAELGASYFVFENVKGLTVGKQKQFLEEIIEAFSKAGYDVRLPWKVLNAASYGVPQDRQRLILMGAKKGLALPSYPKTTTFFAKGNEGNRVLFGEGPSCRDALSDLPDLEDFEELIEADEVYTEDWGTPSAYARKMRCLDRGSWDFGYKRKWDRNLLTSSMRTSHTEISRARFEATQEGSVEPISRFFRLPADGVSNTLRAGTDSARGAFTSPRPIHYDKSRCVSVREMARLHGFPDWFRFHITKWHGARQIGNSVPPPLARAVAGAVLEALGVEPEAPKAIVKLGDPELLRLDMSQAAEYWGMPVIIGKRDRKSGAKKRKQEEIEVQRRGEVAYG
jgi:DNA (cytosine-5)-methyltransferase 1